jgi:hypothetical protein
MYIIPKMKLCNCSFYAIQPNIPGKPPIPLFVLHEAIPGHGTDSTVTRRSIEAAGHTVPPEAIAAQEAALDNYFGRELSVPVATKRIP